MIESARRTKPVPMWVVTTISFCSAVPGRSGASLPQTASTRGSPNQRTVSGIVSGRKTESASV